MATFECISETTTLGQDVTNDDVTLFVNAVNVDSMDKSAVDALTKALRRNCRTDIGIKEVVVIARNHTLCQMKNCFAELARMFPKTLVTGYAFEQDKLCFSDVFDIVARTNLEKDGFLVLADYCIVFDKTLSNIKQMGLASNKKIQCVWEEEPTSSRHVCWAWHSKYTPPKVACDSGALSFDVNEPETYQRVCYILSVLGYAVFNEPELVKQTSLYVKEGTQEEAQEEAQEEVPVVVCPSLIVKPSNASRTLDIKHPLSLRLENNNMHNAVRTLVHEMKALDRPFVIPRLGCAGGLEVGFVAVGLSALRRGSFAADETAFCNTMRQQFARENGVVLDTVESIVGYADSYLSPFLNGDAYLDSPSPVVATATATATATAERLNAINKLFESKGKNWICGKCVLDATRIVGQFVPWTHALRDCRILVVSPFVNDIENSLKMGCTSEGEGKSVMTISGQKMFPDCTFSFMMVPSVTTYPMRDVMQEHTRRLAESLNQQTFDVALVDFGSYGNLLLGEIHKLGKSGINIGSSLRTFFGILSREWQKENGIVSRLVESNLEDQAE